jgi:hypothetical protein
MNIFAKLEGFFKKEQTALAALFKRIAPLVSEAEPIVKAISACVSTAAVLDPALAPEASILSAVTGFVAKATADETAAATFATANASAPLKSVLLNAASLVLSKTTKTNATAVSDFDTAAQLAYATVKQALASAPVVVGTP